LGAHVPFRATESEAVGELSAQSGPELLPLLLGQVQHIIVIALELFVLLGDLGEGLIRAVLATAISTAAAAVTTTSTTATAIFLEPQKC